jgi:hypothetical protein
LALVTLFHVLVVVERINSLADLAPQFGYFASDGSGVDVLSALEIT